MGQQTLDLTISLKDEVSNAELDRLTREMRRQIAMLDVEEARLAPGPEPEPGTKAAGLVTIGDIVVSLAAGGAVNSLIDFVKYWVHRRNTREATITVKAGDKEVIMPYTYAYKSPPSPEETARFVKSVLKMLE